MKTLLLLVALLFCATVPFAQVSKTVDLTQAGNLSATLTSEELASITDLTVTGNLDARDFKTMRDQMPVLASIDLSGATIVAYSGIKGTSTLTSYLPNSIPEYAFSQLNDQGKISLTSIKLPDNVTQISKFAFINCPNLIAVSIPSGLQTLGERAFGWCTSLGQVTLPSTVKYIGNYALSTTAISAIYLPENVEYIGSGVFYQCHNLPEITVSLSNQYYCSIDGVLFNKNHSELLQYPNGKTAIFYDAPKGLQRILDRSFDGGNSYLESITLPEGVTELGIWAFVNLRNLKKINIPSTVSTIKSGAFFSSNKLTTIIAGPTVPPTLAPGSNVFFDVDKLLCSLYVPNGAKAAYQAADQWKDFQNIIELTYVPDDKFEQALIDLGYDAGPLDNYVPTNNIKSVQSLNLYRKGIADLTGIQDFAALSTLDCSYNNLTAIDLSNNLELRNLICPNNQLSALNLSANRILSVLRCYSNSLKSLILPSNMFMTQLYCNDNQLTSLDISGLSKLYFFNCSSNQLTSLDVSKNTELINLHCYLNQLSSLNVSQNLHLLELACNFNQLSSLDISQNIALRKLFCQMNKLSTLDVSNNKALMTLICYSNLLTALDVSKNPALIGLECSKNKLTSLAVNNGSNGLMTGNNTLFSVTENPGLYCIQVDNPTLAATYTDWKKDPQASYSANCSMPIANAGVDQRVKMGDLVTLDATLSSDPSGDILTYHWTAPAEIVLDLTNPAKPTFTAPVTNQTMNYSFQLIVSDGVNNSVADEVSVNVINIYSPTLQCNDITVHLNPNGSYSLSPTDIRNLTAGTVDDVDSYKKLLVVAEPNEFSCVHVGVPVKTKITVTDLNNNLSVGYAMVSVLEVTPPVFTSRVKTLSATVNGTSTYTLPDLSLTYQAVDVCGNVNYQQIPEPGKVYSSSAKETIILQAFDQSGNSTQINIPLVVTVNSKLKSAEIEIPGNGEEKMSFELYPNPSSGIVNIFTSKVVKNVSVEAFTSSGVSVIRKTFLQGALQIDLSNQVEGIYFIHVTSDQGNAVFKIIKK